MATQNIPSTPAPAAPKVGSIVPEVKAQPVPQQAAPVQQKAAATAAKAQTAATNATGASLDTVKGQGKAGAAATGRTMAEIESDMDATRERLAETITQLQEALAPKNIMNRQVEKVKSFYVDEYGAVRPEKVAMTVGAVVAGVVVIKVVKSIFS
ncbi:MAG: hypothetical protein QG597_357 [Actinomycetota bacterium]|nr:hypothetical protein [Actinomycetota bacterium]